MSAPPPGPLPQEAARLLEALQGWAHDHGDIAAAADGDRAVPPTAGMAGAPAGPCRYCPLCRLLALLRGDRPEATARVAEAGASFLAAVRAALDDVPTHPSGAAAPAPGGTAAPAPGSTARVEPIDLS